MHVHVLHPDSSPGRAGLIAALRAGGHEITTDVLRDESLAAAAARGHDLADRLVRDRPEALLAWGWQAGLAAQVAVRGARRHLGGAPPIPVVQRLFAPGRSTDRERRRMEGALARGASRVLTLGSADADTVVKMGARRTAVRIVPPGVDTAVFADRGPAWPRDRRRLVGSAGTDPAALQRLVDLVAGLPGCELVLVARRASRQAALDAVAALRADVGHRVRVHDRGDDEVALRTLPPLLRSADLALCSGDDEPDVELALQAMSCGVPVAALHGCGLEEVLADGVTGLLAPASPAEAYGDVVRRLLGDRMARESLGLAASDRARASFDWSGVGAAVSRVLEELALPGAPRAVKSAGARADVTT